MAPREYKQRIAKRFIALTLLVALVTGCAALASLHWFAELFSHFRPHYTVFALLCVLGLAALRVWRWAALASALALWNGYPVAQMWLQEQPPAAAVSHPITVFHFNVGLHHEQPGRVSSYLRRRAKLIDVVVLLEASTQFDPILDEIKDIFPHQIKYLEDSPFGIALASRFPLAGGEASFKPLRLYPHIEALIKLPNRSEPLALYALHAPPPVSGNMARDRNTKLDYIAQRVARQPQATPVVVGDFNLTPWSPHFDKFVADSGLRDARTPRRFAHTWPVTFDNANLGLAIDHSFAHPSLPLVKREIGPDLGSDHLPVTVTFGY